MSPADKIRDEIDNYKDSIYAIVGLMNFYAYNSDSRKMVEEVKLFQGRKLESENGPGGKGKKPEFVTPDIGVLDENNRGVLGEVKCSFPKSQDHWMDDFEQLMSYDQSLSGWPSPDKKVLSHDIILLLHHSRGQAVERFYLERNGKEINFSRPFSIIEFNRSDQRKAYIFFRIKNGAVTNPRVQKQLQDGVPVPMNVFIEKYSKLKIYDCEPPLPYLLEIIWSNVIVPVASEDSRFLRLRKKQKFELEFDVDGIVAELTNGYSFNQLNADGDGQPQMPKKEWVLRAISTLVNSGEARWIQTNEKVLIDFRKFDDILEHFISICVSKAEDENQQALKLDFKS